MTEDRLQTLGRSNSGRDNPVAEFARDSECARSISGDIKRDRVIQIYKVAIAMEVADLTAQTFGVVSGFAMLEKIADNSRLFTKIGEAHRRQAHHATSGMAGAEA